MCDTQFITFNIISDRYGIKGDFIVLQDMLHGRVGGWYADDILYNI